MKKYNHTEILGVYETTKDNSKESDRDFHEKSICLESLNLPRDSLELIAITLPKDNILKSFEGKDPKIVQADSREDARTICNGIYEKLREVAASVVSCNYNLGHQLYQELNHRLQKEIC